MSLSPDQLAARGEGISASEVAALVGCNPYESPIDVYLRKTGQVPPRNDNQRTKWGHKLEPIIIADYEEMHGVRVDKPGTLRRRTEAWWYATPDGLVYSLGATRPDRGLEVKVHDRDALLFGGLEYGNPGTDQVPAHELIQCQWGIGATGLDRWDLIAFLGGAPAEYAIDRDDELIEMLREASYRFLVDHVQAEVPPPPDGSTGWEEWLKRRWKANTTDMLSIDDNPEALELVHHLQLARVSKLEATDIEEKLIQHVKLIIEGRAGITWKNPNRKKPDAITWKFSNPSHETNWEIVAADMRQMASLLASGCSSVFERALICLRSLGTNSLGASTRATITAAELAELLEVTQRALTEIAKPAAIVAARTKEIPGQRPFNVPRHAEWKGSKPEET